MIVANVLYIFPVLNYTIMRSLVPIYNMHGMFAQTLVCAIFSFRGCRYVNPVVAIILGWMLAGERMTTHDGLAAIIIRASVIIIHKANNYKAVAPVLEEKVSLVLEGNQND